MLVDEVFHRLLVDADFDVSCPWDVDVNERVVSAHLDSLHRTHCGLPMAARDSLSLDRTPPPGLCHDNNPPLGQAQAYTPCSRIRRQ
jgi:hypothetical protein